MTEQLNWTELNFLVPKPWSHSWFLFISYPVSGSLANFIGSLFKNTCNFSPPPLLSFLSMSLFSVSWMVVVTLCLVFLLPFYSAMVCVQASHILGSKEFACTPGDTRDVGSIPGSGRSPGEGNGNPLQYSCLENPMDRRAWRATVHRVTKIQIWLSDWACSQSVLSVTI